MSDELKLLMAMCKALGLDVKVENTKRHTGPSISYLSGFLRRQGIEYDFIDEGTDNAHYREVSRGVEYIVTKIEVTDESI